MNMCVLMSTRSLIYVASTCWSPRTNSQGNMTLNLSLRLRSHCYFTKQKKKKSIRADADDGPIKCTGRVTRRRSLRTLSLVGGQALWPRRPDLRCYYSYRQRPYHPCTQGTVLSSNSSLSPLRSSASYIAFPVLLLHKSVLTKGPTRQLGK